MPFWENLTAGQCGIDRITLLDPSTFPSQIAAEVKDYRPEDYIDKRKLKYYARPTQFAVTAYNLAKFDAQLTSLDPFRTDVILGTATSEFGEYDRQVFNNPTAGREFVEGSFDPLVLARIFINGPACAIALSERIQGLVTTLSSACASALNAVGIGMQRIQDGRSEIVIAGGTDCGVNYFSLNSFCASDSLATKNETPKDALCPFDERHTKSVLGEGAAVFIIEELEHALSRGALPYAEIVGYAQENENVNALYMIDKSGVKWAHTMSLALDEAGGDVDFVCAHAPSDSVIDAVETRAMRTALGERLAEIPVASIKGAIGSPLGTAGGLQLAVASMALRTKTVPPNYNYKVPDPECSLKVVRKSEKCEGMRQVLVNGHGFGGVNVALVLREMSA